MIIAGECHHTADVIIQHLNLNAACRFLLEHFQNRVPELSFFNNEILHIDEMFSRCKIVKHFCIHILAKGKILLLRIGENMCVRYLHQHFCLRCGCRTFRFQIQKVCVIFRFVCAFFQFIQPFNKLLLKCSGIEHKVQHKTRNGDNQHKQKPRHLVVGIVIGGNNANYTDDLCCPSR